MSPTSAPSVALTFDDGPGPYTAGLLDTLDAHGARATFFDVGEMVAARPELARRQAGAGHEIGNHSWSHPRLTGLSERRLREEIDRTCAVIEQTTGSAPGLLRPPFGDHDERVRRAAGMPLIMWSVDPEDWRIKDTGHVTRAVLDAVRPGDVVLMHDIQPTTVAAVPEILQVLSGRGYRFVTVSELYRELQDEKPLRPGTAYDRPGGAPAGRAG
ncbi:polysaccharide deacetylase family protein [Streptomyces aidingensis]|nr:polysaccharide deacetylase family protein [Streptomyces aidingensis]